MDNITEPRSEYRVYSLFKLAICIMSNSKKALANTFLDPRCLNTLHHLAKKMTTAVVINFQPPYDSNDIAAVCELLRSTGTQVYPRYNRYQPNDEGHYPIMQIRQDSLVSPRMAEYTLMMDDDQMVTKEFVDNIESVLDYIESHPKVGVVGLTGPIVRAYYEYRHTCNSPRSHTFSIPCRLMTSYRKNNDGQREKVKQRSYLRLALNGGFLYRTDRVLPVWDSYDWSMVYSGWDDSLRTAMLLLSGYTNVKCSLHNIHDSSWGKFCWNTFHKDLPPFDTVELPKFNNENRRPYREAFEDANGLARGTLNNDYQPNNYFSQPSDPDREKEFFARSFKDSTSLLYEEELFTEDDQIRVKRELGLL